MKIGIDIRNIGKQRTGDEVVFFNLVKNLGELDNSNEYFLFTDLAENVLPNISQKLGILGKPNFKIISLKSPNKFCWNMRVLPWYLRKNPVDVYHTQYITPFFVSRKIKVITHIHDVSFFVYPELIKKSDLFFLKLLMPRSIKRADKIVAISDFTKNEIVKYYKINPEKIEVVYNAVSDDFLENDYSGNELFQIRKKYNLPEKYFLYIGTLQPRKNIPILLEAFAKIKEKISDTKLVLAGNKNAHNFDVEIDRMIEKLQLEESIVFPGFIEEKDKAAIFFLAKAFVFPSLYEGFGIPILEAMSKKIPVLASKIPVHLEVAENGAFYFSKENVDEISEKLYTILEDKNLREKLIDLGKKRVDFFSWKKSAKKMLSVYKKLI